MIGIRVEPQFKELLQELADSENRTLSNFIFNALQTYIKEHKDMESVKKAKE